MMTPTTRAVVESLGYDFAAFAALWVQDLALGDVLDEIATHLDLRLLDVSSVAPEPVAQVMGQDLNDVEMAYLILSKVRAGGGSYPNFTPAGEATFRGRDVLSFEKLAMDLVLIGSGGGGPPVDPNILFGYKAGDDWAKAGGTFTRASLATYVDAGGMVRNAPHNFLVASNDLGNAGAWVNGVVLSVTSNSAIAPDGTNTASTIVFDPVGSGGISQVHHQQLSAGGLPDLPKSTSAWVKGTAGQTMIFGTDNFTDPHVITFTGAWQRVTFQTVGSCQYVIFRNRVATETAGTVYVWHTQHENNRNPSDQVLVTTISGPRFDGLRDAFTTS